MTIRELHARLGAIMEENEKGGPESAARNDREVMITLNRTGRKRPFVYPVHHVPSAVCVAELFDLDGKGGLVEFFAVPVDSVDVRASKPKSLGSVED